MARPKKNTVQLSDTDVKKLKGILKNKNTSQTIANRCRILLSLDENHPPVHTYDQCMDLFCVSRATISNVAKTFVQDGLDEVLKLKRNINLVMDNLNTHAPSSLYKAFTPAEARRIAKRLEIHYTPKHGSWLNIAEIELNVMTRQCLSRRIDSMEYLQSELSVWENERNHNQAGVNWQFKTKDARIKLTSLYPNL